jgi:hypothetical protein
MIIVYYLTSINIEYYRHQEINLSFRLKKPVASTIRKPVIQALGYQTSFSSIAR